MGFGGFVCMFNIIGEAFETRFKGSLRCMDDVRMGPSGQSVGPNIWAIDGEVETGE